MDAGVLQLHVFPHEPSPHRPRLLAPGQKLTPALTCASPIERSAPVSLIIPTYFNQRLKNGSLHYLLEGIEQSSTIEEVVFVVSGDSGKEARDFESLAGNKKLIYVPCEQNQRARARNLGAAAATHEMLLFLDDDMVLQNWRLIDVFVSQLISEQYDCALFPRRNYARFPLLYDGAGLQQAIGDWRNDESSIDESLIFDPLRHGCSFKTMAFCFPGCFMLIRRDAFQLIGGFPEEFEGWGFEDSDFAVRATSVLRVMNLFYKSHSLLHIDHPVSPYKSEEYEINFRKFLAVHAMSDVDRLCTQILQGEDFGDGMRIGERTTSHFAPLQHVAESAQLPALQDEQARRSILRNYEHILEKRLEKGCDAIPQHIVLHGSRSAGTATAGSDYDVLVLFRGGIMREFFTCTTNDGQSTDIEFADCAKFEGIAQRPVFYPLYGPLELAKIACGRVLFGSANEWEAWVQRQLSLAIRNGRIYWLLYALGINLRKEKLGALRTQFLSSLRSMLIRTDGELYRPDIEQLDDLQPELLGSYLRVQLDNEHSGWRDDMLHHRRVFAFQVPEVWDALRWTINSVK